MRRRRDTQGGIALAEVATATAIIAIGLLAAAAALHYATDTLESARLQTLAVFLVERRLEALKAVAVADWTHPDLAPGVYVESCDPLAMTCSSGPVAGTTTRTTVITDGPGGMCSVACKLVRVTVTYRAPARRGVDVATVFTRRT
jgi:Tfp pilus assembly protein PilV